MDEIYFKNPSKSGTAKGTKHNCKHCNTVELLVYFTLNLTINFISEVCTKKMSGIATTSQSSEG